MDIQRKPSRWNQAPFCAWIIAMLFLEWQPAGRAGEPSPDTLRPAFWVDALRAEPISRDEMLEDLGKARVVYVASPAGLDRVALVICGRGHCEYGLGTPARVEQRVPGISQRIVLLSESGDLELSEAERKQAREIEIPHSFLKALGRPAGDYFHIMATRPNGK